MGSNGWVNLSDIVQLATRHRKTFLRLSSSGNLAGGAALDEREAHVDDVLRERAAFDFGDERGRSLDADGALVDVDGRDRGMREGGEI